MTEAQSFQSANEKPAGFLEYTMRSTFRDLCRVYGFGGARQLVAEIINDEAERKSNGQA